MSPYIFLFAALGLLSCSSGNDTASRRSPISSEDALGKEEVEITAVVSSPQNGLARLGAGSVKDFEIGIKCNYGSGNAEVVRSYKKSVFDSKNAKLPKGSKNCASHLKTLSVAVSASAKTWTLNAPQNIGGSSFNNNAVVTYTYSVPASPSADDATTPATAKVQRPQEFPAAIDTDTAKNKVEFAFALSTQNANVSTDYTVNASRIDSQVNITGSTPPLYDVTVKSATADGGVCSLVLKAVCSRATQVNNKLDACNDVKLSRTIVSIDGVTVAASNVKLDPTAEANTINFPYSLTGCDPGLTGTLTKNLEIAFVDNTDASAVNKSTLTAPVTIKLTFNPN